jgi:hypothetical protein
MDLYEFAILIDQIVRGFGSDLLFRFVRGSYRYTNPTSLNPRGNPETTILHDGTLIECGKAVEKAFVLGSGCI